MCALSKTSCQCAIGCELKVSSMIAVSTLMFAASFAGSANRGSFKRSVRSRPAARAGILSGVATITNQTLSELLYTFSSAFAGFFRSCCGANFAPESGLNRDAGGPNARGQKRSGNGRTFARAFAPIKRCYNRGTQSHARRSIARPGEWPGRRCARIVQERKQTGPRPVGREVESGKSRVRSRVAVAGDVGVNQPRIELRDLVIVELEFFARGMRRVDDEHVRPLGQALDNFCRVRRFEINRYPTLVAIVQVPHVGILGLRLRRNLVSDPPQFALGRFDLDHVGTEVG